ncbi:unnamed protein product, partial [marine sediment metagenome]
HGSIQGRNDDDHSAYPLVSNFEANRATIATNWTDLTDAGATTLHKHDHGGMDGLDDGDHGAVYYTKTEINTWRSNVDQTEMSYLDGVTSDIQDQLDARCLESVLGTSIGAGLILDSAVLKTDIELQAIAALTSAADRYIRFTGSGSADLRTYANVLSDLSGSAGAAFAWNSQNLTGVGTIASGILTTTTVKLTDLTDGYVPYHVADATGLANSSIRTDGINVGINVASSTVYQMKVVGDALTAAGSGIGLHVSAKTRAVTANESTYTQAIAGAAQ